MSLSGWNRDMASAPRGQVIKIACRIKTSPYHTHRWIAICEFKGPTFLDFAWREHT